MDEETAGKLTDEERNNLLTTVGMIRDEEARYHSAKERFWLRNTSWIVPETKRYGPLAHRHIPPLTLYPGLLFAALIIALFHTLFNGRSSYLVWLPFAYLAIITIVEVWHYISMRAIFKDRIEPPQALLQRTVLDPDNLSPEQAEKLYEYRNTLIKRNKRIARRNAIRIIIFGLWFLGLLIAYFHFLTV